MNKQNTRKGFTTVELVIVIAVIAILATVLIPTFSYLINDAKESSALLEARGIYTQASNAAAKEGKALESGYIVVDNFYFKVSEGKIIAEPVTEEDVKDLTQITAPTED